MRIETVTYPPIPWKMRGSFWGAVRLVSVHEAQKWLPPGVKTAALGGWTVGGLLLVRYGPGSSLEYNELIVFPALVRWRGKLGLWISHIYVDDLSSLKGGREMFGVPKEIATFDFDPGKDRLRVLQNEQVLLSARMKFSPVRFPAPLWGAAMGRAAGDIRRFTIGGRGRLGLARAALKVPGSSPFSSLNLDRPALTFHAGQVEAVIGNICVLI